MQSKAKISLVGKKVTIKASGDWGIVRMIEGDVYHIGLFGDTRSSMVFDRSEFTVARHQEQK